MKECDYRSVSFAVVRAVFTYMYWFSVLAGSLSTDQQEKKERRQTGPRAGRIMTPETANSIRLPLTYNAGLPLRWYTGTYLCILVQRYSRFCE